MQDKAGGWGAIPVKLFPNKFKELIVSGKEGILPEKALKLISIFVNFAILETVGKLPPKLLNLISISLMTTILEKISSGITPSMVVCEISRYVNLDKLDNESGNVPVNPKLMFRKFNFVKQEMNDGIVP